MMPLLFNSPKICSYTIQDKSVDVLFNGLLAELPAILNSFFTNTTSDYIGVVGQGLWLPEACQTSTGPQISSAGCKSPHDWLVMLSIYLATFDGTYISKA